MRIHSAKYMPRATTKCTSPESSATTCNSIRDSGWTSTRHFGQGRLDLTGWYSNRKRHGRELRQLREWRIKEPLMRHSRNWRNSRPCLFLFEYHPVRSSRPCPKCRVEVQPESRLELQVVALDAGDGHVVVALGMYFAG